MNKRACGHTCAAGEGFALHTAFVGADGDVLAVDDVDEVGIGAVRSEVLVVADGSTMLEHVKIFQSVCEHHSVGNTGVDGVDGALQTLNVDVSIEIQIKRIGHGDADIIAYDVSTEGAGDGFKGDMVRAITSQHGGELSKTASPIAAHFGLTAIGIIIAEPEIGTCLGRLDCEQAVSTNAALAVTEQSNLLSAEAGIERTVIDDNEVVARAVHFVELQSHDCVGFLVAVIKGVVKSLIIFAKFGLPAFFAT